MQTYSLHRSAIKQTQTALSTWANYNHWHVLTTQTATCCMGRQVTC